MKADDTFYNNLPIHVKCHVYNMHHQQVQFVEKDVSCPYMDSARVCPEVGQARRPIESRRDSLRKDIAFGACTERVVAGVDAC